MNDKELKLEEIEASHTLGYAGFKEPRVSCVDNLPCIFLRNASSSSCFAQTAFFDFNIPEPLNLYESTMDTEHGK
jgi:hypothetical protein